MTNNYNAHPLEIFDDALMGVFRSTIDGKFLYVNKAFSSILKYPSPQDLIDTIDNIGNQLYTKNHDRDKLVQQIRTEEKLINYEIQYYCRDGSIKTALLNMQIKRDTEGKELCLEGFISDITALKEKEARFKEKDEALQRLNAELEATLRQLSASQKKLRDNYNQLKEKEAALLESEARWVFALEGSGDGVWDWNIETNSFYRSKQYKAMRGFREDEIRDSYEDWINFVHPEDRQWVEAELNKYVNDQIPSYVVEYRIRHKNGNYIWIQERGKAILRSASGRAIRMVGTHRNVTQEKKYQEALLYQKRLFECLFNNSPDAIVHFDKNEIIVGANSQFLKLFDYSFEEIKGQNINNVIDFPENKNGHLTFAGLAEGDHQFQDTVRYDKNGNPIKVFVRGLPVLINNKIVGGYGVYTDVRAMKDAEEKIKEQQKILESHFKYSPDAVVRLDLNFEIQEINRKFTDLFGYTSEESIGRNIDDLIVSEKYKEECRMINNLVLENNQLEIDTKRRRKDGALVDVCIRGGPTIVDGKIIGLHGIYTDITERKVAEARVNFLSYHDNLTGLYNRAFFEEELKRLDTQRKYPLSIIIGDVNGLKLTNDVFGHLVGDKILTKTAEIMQQACRREEIVCRWGGDEFAILLPNTDKEATKEVCQRIYSLSQKSTDTPISISISLGYAVKTHTNQSMTDIIKEAEEQMYRNKLIESKSTRSHIINSLQQSLHEHSHETEEHTQRMKAMSIKLGEGLQLDNDKLNELSLLAILHDIGKIAISDTILQNPGRLSPDDWEKMKRHSEIGYRIAETSPELVHIAKYILFHHERWDGTGYPHGLKGDEIPLLSRIISVVDAYDVMTHARVYNKAISHQEALEEIKRCAGSQFDPLVANRFIEIFSDYEK
ncbi:PAS domain S-box protein [Alkaliphilus serpentinus]|uniref:PAS domain S-box protein n=1 Tax=Alkaliphilus serpentinus TaxID=1482731 RepID=A0A833M7B5_9FIRM|nr:PAS domain S-box protein [Alkaliphilus serpentinus]KAB3530042.1 PAS domain S-box protein [Alkaliphilus serpentinus]